MPIYFKVFQDRESLDDSFFVCELEDIEETARLAIIDLDYGGLSPAVFEPIEMSKEEFDNMPEFKGC